MDTQYTLAGKIGLGDQRPACEELATLFSHLPNMGVRVLALAHALDGTLVITLDRPLSADEREHFGMQ